MFSVSRIADALESQGFFVAYEEQWEAAFIRPNAGLRIFEAVEVTAGWQRGGKAGDIACAGTSIALTPGRFTAIKGIAEAECFSDWSPTKTREQALAWERTIVQTVSPTLETLIRDRSEQLLSRTAEARASVEKYLELVDRGLSIPENIAALTQGAADGELREARRLGRTEGFICLPERACYDLISLLISRYSGSVDGDRTRFWGKSPNEVPELNWRFQLLASRLFPERGWELLGG